MSIKKTSIKLFLKGGNSILQNVYILYFIFIVSLFNLFYFVSSANYIFATIFILVGFITSFFSKNMIVILCIALTTTHILKYGNTDLSEGFDNNDETSLEDTTTNLEDKKDKTQTDDKDILDKISDKLNSSVKSSDGVDPAKQKKMEGILENYRELLDLQNKIKDGMNNIKEPLSQAEDIVSKMAKQLGIPYE